jgi:hypothetical protein
VNFLKIIPGIVFAVGGCVVIGFGIKAIAPDVNRGSFDLLILGFLIFTFGSLLASVAYLAPKYGTSTRSGYSGNGQVMPLVIAFGVIALVGELGLLLWTAH